MSSSRALGDAFRLLGTASLAIEDVFVTIGNRLETAIEILDRLGQTFNTLQLDLASDGLAAATASMGEVAQRIADLTVGTDGVPEALRDIGQLADAVGLRLTEMQKAVKTVDVLAINAKIAGAHISSAGEEFSSFADEIGRALEIAQANLSEFSVELGQVAATVREASKGQAALQQRQITAAASVPRALSQSVGTISDRRGQAARASTVIQEKTLDVVRQVGVAVTALQIGDTTRQRIEHAEYAIDLLQVMLGGHGQSRHNLPRRTPRLPPHVTEAQRGIVIGIGAQLLVEQLSDTANELDSQLQQVLTVLTTLTRDAREMARLGQSAFGATGLEGGTFLDDLRDNVAQANDLLDALGVAQRDADDVVRSVLSAASSLTGHMQSIQSLESDIRLMGLNTTLKCSRLGTEGRSLTVIAQELRSCSNVTATEAETIMQLLDKMRETGMDLTTRDTTRRSDETQAIATIMRNSIDRLDVVARSLTEALCVLARDSEAVVALLDETLGKVEMHLAIGESLRQSVATLADLAHLSPTPDTDLIDVLEDLQSSLATSYTMARKREIHARIFHTSGAGTPVAAAAFSSSSAAQDVELEDMLF
jgi:methyl-accepting chemotaxis protein